MSIDWAAVQNALYDWVVAATGLPDDGQTVYWGQQQPGARHPEPAVEMRLYTIDDVGRTWLDTYANYYSFPAKTVTLVDPSLDQLTVTAHGFNTGDGPIRVVSDGTQPGNVGASTDYWIIKVDANTVALATTFALAMAGTRLDIQSAGTGNITVNSTAKTLQAGKEIMYYARGLVKLRLSLTCWTSAGVGPDMATSILRRIASKRSLPSIAGILDNAGIGLTSMEHVHAAHGIKDAVLFEPRATMEIYLDVPSEETETGTIIETVDVQDQITGNTKHLGPVD